MGTERLIAPNDFRTPAVSRKCTDVAAFLVYICCQLEANVDFKIMLANVSLHCTPYSVT